MENINLIRKIAWSFHKSTGLDYDDLFQEAYLAYEYAMETYDPKREVYLSTFLWNHIANQLSSYFRREKDIKEPFVSIEEHPNLQYLASKPAPPYYENLSKEAQGIAELVLSAPKVFVAVSTEDALARIERTMIRKGWTKTKVLIGIRDLQLAFS